MDGVSCKRQIVSSVKESIPVIFGCIWYHLVYACHSANALHMISNASTLQLDAAGKGLAHASCNGAAAIAGLAFLEWCFDP